MGRDVICLNKFRVLIHVAWLSCSSLQPLYDLLGWVRKWESRKQKMRFWLFSVILGRGSEILYEWNVTLVGPWYGIFIWPFHSFSSSISYFHIGIPFIYRSEELASFFTAHMLLVMLIIQTSHTHRVLDNN